MTMGMIEYSRYAIYFMPRQGDPLHEFGRNWFGYDPMTGESLTPKPLPGWSLEEHEALIETPKKYGLHATLKAPFRLADGVTEADLLREVAALAERIGPVDLGPLELKKIGSFLALCPTADQGPINALAAACVTELDHLRAPLTEAEIARRNPDKLSNRQRELLDEWGYPYVLEEFRFHVTVSGSLPKDQQDAVYDAISVGHLSSPKSATIANLVIAGEVNGTKMFQEAGHCAIG